MSEGHDRRSVDNDLGYEEKRSRSAKDRRRWCRGRSGVSHQVVVTVPGNIAGWKVAKSHGDRACGFSIFWAQEWYCHHVRMCTECGKVLDDCLGRQECPTYAAETAAGAP